jgi:hypothetical protein
MRLTLNQLIFFDLIIVNFIIIIINYIVYIALLCVVESSFFARFTSDQIKSDRNHWYRVKSAEESIISCLNELNESIILLFNKSDDEIE